MRTHIQKIKYMPVLRLNAVCCRLNYMNICAPNILNRICRAQQQSGGRRASPASTHANDERDNISRWHYFYDIFARVAENVCVCVCINHTFICACILFVYIYIGVYGGKGAVANMNLYFHNNNNTN